MGETKSFKSGISVKHWFGYMFGDFGGCMTFTLMSSIVTRYYTNVLEINDDVLFVLIMIWNIWDAINDPLMGAIMDKLFAKSRNPKGKFRPWILRATPLLAVTAAAFWVLPTFFHGIKMLVVLFLCKILYEGAYTMFNIPMGSLLSAMSTTDSERASLSSARGVGSALGNAIPAVVAVEIIQQFGTENAAGYRVVGIACALIGFGLCLLHYYMTEERNTRVAEEGAENIKWGDVLVSLKKNRLFLALCIHGICICAMQSLFNSVATYMYQDVYGNMDMMQWLYPASAPAMVIIFALSPQLSKKLGLQKMIRYALFLGVISFAGLFVLVRITEVSDIVFLILSSFAMGIPTVSILMQWGLVAEAIDYNEAVIGKKTEGSIYGTFNLARRIGGGIGQGLVVKMLSWFEYDASLSEIGADQSATAVLGIQLANLLLPAVFVFGSWLAFRFVWRISPDIKAKIDHNKEERLRLASSSKK